jgi:hypothetical protein
MISRESYFSTRKGEFVKNRSSGKQRGQHELKISSANFPKSLSPSCLSFSDNVVIKQ